MCRNYVKTGFCAYGDNCSFDHPARRAQRQPSPSPARPAVSVPAVPPMFYATYRRGSNGEIIDPALLPAPVQAQKSLYFRSTPCSLVFSLGGER